MERQARDYFDRIDSLGGVVPAIEKGFFQKEIAAATYNYQRESDEKKMVPMKPAGKVHRSPASCGE